MPMLEQFSKIGFKEMIPKSETFKEVAKIEANESSPLQSVMENIENTSLGCLKAQNELIAEKITSERILRIEINRADGASREELAYKELQHEFPEKEGCSIQREQYLRDKDGNIVKDPVTGETRRIDFMILKEGEVIKSIEVTSRTAPKDMQMAKENRIRNEGGNFIKDRDTCQLFEMPSGTQTEIRRYL